MKYRYSNIDQSNIAWFTSDQAVASLMCIRISEGSIRGLNKGVELSFKYPITTIAGKNGTGKTTILALTACAYHNTNKKYHLVNRKHPYYTFSDFFIQSSEEVPVEGIEIWYQFLFNNWKKSQNLPSGKGLGWQRRKKIKGGHWNNYSKRINRDVVYLGIGRIVPPTEISASRTYRRIFSPLKKNGWEEEVKKYVGYILDKDYTQFYYKNYYKYRLPLVSSEDKIYSGFNMGAGENALFEMLSTIFSFSKGILLIVDEIELGLHEEAQIKLIKTLKEICNDRHIQVICTTHSPTILEMIPPEGRIYIDKVQSKTEIIPSISPIYASGKLSGKKNCELHILVEDDFSKDIADACLSNEIRTRVNIIPIGSAAAVIRQVSGFYKIDDNKKVIALLDGDKENEQQKLINLFIKTLESSSTDDREWISNHLFFLPGDTWPEKWILSKCLENCTILDILTKDFDLSKNQLKDYIKSAIRSDKHNEFYTLSEKLDQDQRYLSKRFTKSVINVCQNEKQRLLSIVCNFLT